MNGQETRLTSPVWTRFWHDFAGTLAERDPSKGFGQNDKRLGFS